MQEIEFIICGTDGEVYLERVRKGQFSLPDKDTLVRIQLPEAVVSGVVQVVAWTYADDGTEQVEIMLRDVYKVSDKESARAQARIVQEKKAQACIEQAKTELGPDATTEQIESYALTLLRETTED